MPTRRSFLISSGSALALTSLGSTREGANRKKLVILAGRPSHPAGMHEFNAGTLLLKKCLEKVSDLETVWTRNGWPENEKVFEGADGIFLYSDGGGGHPFLQGDRLRVMSDFMSRGIGLMCAHYAVEVPKDRAGKQFQDWIGGYYETNWSCNPIWSAEFTALPQHPITRGVSPFAAKDEWYFNMRFRPDMKGVVPILAATPSDATRDGPYVSPRGPYKHIQEARGRKEALLWAVERPDGGRGVGFTGGHFHQNWAEENFRKTVLNALLWICKMEVPANGVASTVTEEEMKQNLDPKGKK